MAEPSRPRGALKRRSRRGPRLDEVGQRVSDTIEMPLRVTYHPELTSQVSRQWRRAHTASRGVNQRGGVPSNRGEEPSSAFPLNPPRGSVAGAEFDVEDR